MTKAITTKPLFCPYCTTEIPQEEIKGRKDRCPECFRIILKPEDKHFRTPDYISTQHKQLVSNVQGIIPENANTNYDHIDALTDITLAEDAWFRNCLHHERVAALLDAFGVVRHLPYAKANKEDIQYMISIAKKIGQAAEKIDEMYKAGVVLYDREIRSSRPHQGEADVDQASAATGRDT